MKITPLDGNIGAELTDLDLAGPWVDTPDELKAIRDTFSTRHLLLIRDPDLAPEDQVRLIEALGLVVDKWTDGAKYGFLSNKLAVAPNDGQHNAYFFHSDLMWSKHPIASISLFATVLPDVPAPTMFANAVAAAAALPSDLRERIKGEKAMFLIDFTGGDKRYTEETASEEAPRHTQFLFYDDPLSGQTSLVADSLFMDKIVGWERDASEEMRTELHRYLYDPANVYTHDWQVGDLVVWNNVALQHARPRLTTDGERTHRRVSGTYEVGKTAWDATFRD